MKPLPNLPASDSFEELARQNSHEADPLSAALLECMQKIQSQTLSHIDQVRGRETNEEGPLVKIESSKGDQHHQTEVISAVEMARSDSVPSLGDFTDASTSPSSSALNTPATQQEGFPSCYKESTSTVDMLTILSEEPTESMWKGCPTLIVADASSTSTAAKPVPSVRLENTKARQPLGDAFLPLNISNLPSTSSLNSENNPHQATTTRFPSSHTLKSSPTIGVIKACFGLGGSKSDSSLLHSTKGQTASASPKSPTTPKVPKTLKSPRQPRSPKITPSKSVVFDVPSSSGGNGEFQSGYFSKTIS